MAAQFQTPEDQMSLMLRYTGPSVDDGTMGVYEVAANMVSFSEFVVAAAHSVYGADTEVRAEVRAFNHGSFETDLLFHVSGIAATLLSAYPSVAGMLSTVRESLDLYRFLRGEPPHSITYSADGGAAQVVNNNGQVTVVNIQSLQVTLDPKAGNAVEQFVAKALSAPGVDSVAVGDGPRPLVRIDRDESQYYRPISADVDLTESIVTMPLQIQMPGFKDGLKWKFWDGAQTFQAAIEDREFLGRVDAGEAFRKGDVLICDVRVKSVVQFGGKLKTERTVVFVRQHLIRALQGTIPGLSDDDEDR